MLVSGVVGAVAVVLVAPVTVPNRVEVPGRVLPAQEWVVTRSSNGAVSATLRNYLTGAVQATLAAEPARGDAVRFHLGPAASARTISAGDTIGGFISEETALRLAAISGQVEAAKAELQLSQAGEKEALVEAARQDVIRARAALDYATRVAERQRASFERGIIAQDDLDEAESERRVAEAETAAAEALLEASMSGARDEQVALAQARVDALEEESTLLRSRLQASDLVAPITGLVYRVSSPDTLLMVADTSTYTVMLPIRWADRDRVSPGQEVTLRTTEWGEQPKARVLDIRESSGRAAGQAYLVATAEVVSGRHALTPGLLVRGSIETDRVSLMAYARDLTLGLFRW